RRRALERAALLRGARGARGGVEAGGGRDAAGAPGRDPDRGRLSSSDAREPARGADPPRRGPEPPRERARDDAPGARRGRPARRDGVLGGGARAPRDAGGRTAAPRARGPYASRTCLRLASAWSWSRARSSSAVALASSARRRSRASARTGASRAAMRASSAPTPAGSPMNAGGVGAAAAHVRMMPLGELEPVFADGLPGGQRGHAEDAVEVRPPPLLDGGEQDRGPIHYVVGRHAPAARRAADLPVVRRGTGPGRIDEEPVEKVRLVLRAGEQLLGGPRIEDARQAVQGRSP